MRTLPKSRILLQILVAALAGAAVVCVTPLGAATPKHASAKPKPAPAAQVAKTEPDAATKPAPVATDDDEEEDPDANGVAAVVNDQVVSTYDLRQRTRLVLSTAGMQPTPENIRRLRPQVLDQLKTEKLELIEAQRKNITVSPTEVDKEIDGIMADNKLTMDQLKQILSRSQVAIETLRAQIAVQIAWQKAIEDEYGDRINITEADINDEFTRINQGKDKPHYLVSEIFLAVENPDQDEKVKKNAEDLITQMRSGASFPTIARQFSQSPSAASGGDLGLVYDGELPAELNDPVSKLKPGELTPPVRAAGGYYIMALRDRQEGANAQIPDPATVQPPPPEHPGYLKLARVLLPVPPKAPEDYLKKVAGGAQELRAHFESCEQAQQLVAKVKGGVVFMNLGEMKLSDLSEQIQQELAKTQSGEATVPFMSAAGVEIILRCDQRAAAPLKKFQALTRDQVERRLFQQQISMLARRYIRDLRRQGSVETR